MKITQRVLKCIVKIMSRSFSWGIGLNVSLWDEYQVHSERSEIECIYQASTLLFTKPRGFLFNFMLTFFHFIPLKITTNMVNFSSTVPKKVEYGPSAARNKKYSNLRFNAKTVLLTNGFVRHGYPCTAAKRLVLRKTQTQFTCFVDFSK